MNAQGALHSLLGRLSTILVDEAQLLGGLRGDVEFIKDEMESMNGLLLHLTEANHRDHQVRAWMKLVVGLTRDCEGNVELYVHSVTDAGHHATGLLGYLRRILRFVRTVAVRHQIATRIRELKVRARDVGDRRQRYGVTVPSAADHDDDAFFMDEVHVERRCILLDVPEDEEAYVKKGIDEMIELLLANREPQPTVFSIVCKKRRIYALRDIAMALQVHESHMRTLDEELAERVAREVYERKMSSFDCKALVSMYDDVNWDYKPVVQILREILQQVAPLPSTETSRGDDDKEDEAMQLTKTLEGYLKGKRFLIILQDVDSTEVDFDSTDEVEVYSTEEWDRIRSALLGAAVDCSPGSAIVMKRRDGDVAESPPQTSFTPPNIHRVLCDKAEELLVGYDYHHFTMTLLALCYPNVFASKMLLHLLYVNPRRGITQLRDFKQVLEGCRPSNKSVAKQMLRLSYDELPTKYRSCLFYLTIFPEGDRIRRITVCRRWIAEGLIATRENRAEDEADCCFDALLSWGLILPGEISDAGKIKTCTLHPIVREVITRIARDVNFVNTDLPPYLACHLSIHSRIRLPASHSDHSVEPADRKDIVPFLPFLAKSSQWQLLKMLDLEGCKGLKKDHLKCICKILLLKYLSLRNTDVAALPKQIEKLQCLETLDIRQTAVRAFATKSIMLPMLKHLLAGQAESPSNSSDRIQESFTAVRLPSCVRRMEKLETLSHVEVSHSPNDLIDVGQLLQLRKLGVILHGKKGGFGLLFKQIEKLCGCLRSLSIQINQTVSETEDTPCAVEEVIALASPPKLLQSVNISGITSGLLLWIAELDQLTKITLSETYLGEDYIHILGKLTALRCLRLRRNSYAGSGLRFQEGEFKILESLVVADDTITNITFDAGATPKLEMIIWSFAEMEAISGLLCLPKLKKLELNGDCDPDPVRRALKEHDNRPDFKHKPSHQHREDGSVVATSTP